MAVTPVILKILTNSVLGSTPLVAMIKKNYGPFLWVVVNWL